MENEQIKQALKDCSSGMPDEQVAKKYNIGKTTLFQWKKKYGRFIQQALDSAFEDHETLVKEDLEPLLDDIPEINNSKRIVYNQGELNDKDSPKKKPKRSYKVSDKLSKPRNREIRYTVNMGFTASKDMYEDIKEIAKEEERSLQGQIRYIILQYINKKAKG